MTKTKDLATALRELRLERGLTQGQLAYKAATTPEYISMLETGTRGNPGADLLVRLATALQTTPDYILHRSGMLDIENGHEPLDPQVQHIADILASWPDENSKAKARAIVATIGDALLHVRDTLDEGE